MLTYQRLSKYQLKYEYATYYLWEIIYKSIGECKWCVRPDVTCSVLTDAVHTDDSAARAAAAHAAAGRTHALARTRAPCRGRVTRDTCDHSARRCHTRLPTATSNDTAAGTRTNQATRSARNLGTYYHHPGKSSTTPT